MATYQTPGQPAEAQTESHRKDAPSEAKKAAPQNPAQPAARPAITDWASI